MLRMNRPPWLIIKQVTWYNFLEWQGMFLTTSYEISLICLTCCPWRLLGILQGLSMNFVNSLIWYRIIIVSSKSITDTSSLSTCRRISMRWPWCACLPSRLIWFHYRPAIGLVKLLPREWLCSSTCQKSELVWISSCFDTRTSRRFLITQFWSLFQK